MGSVARPGEELLLLQCARGPAGAPDRAQLRALLSRPLDWSRLLSLAERHAMVPLVAHRLESIGEDESVPAHIRTELRAAFLRNAAQSLMLAAELPRILGELHDAGVPALPYKGPLLALAAYGNPVLRRMRDLDVLIAPTALDRARTVLASRGYRQFTRLLRHSARTRLEYQCGMIRDSDDALVELHWGIAPPNIARSPAFADLWHRRASAALHGVAIPRMSNEDRLIALCIHGSKHGWKRLEWIASLAGVLANDSCDWDIVRRRADELLGTRMVRLGLTLVRDVIGIRLDPSLHRWIDADGAVAKLSAEVTHALFAASPSTAAGEGLTAFQWRLQDTPRGKLRFVTYWPLVRVARRAAASPRFGSTG